LIEPGRRWLGVAVATAVAAIVFALFMGRSDPRVLPIEQGTQFTSDFGETSSLYSGVKYAFWATATVLRWGTLVGLMVLGGGRILTALAARVSSRLSVTALIVMAVLLAVLALVTLPLSYASGYRIEHAFGLSTQTRSAWLLDYVRVRGFWILVYSAAAAGFLTTIRRWPRRGWLVAAGAGMLIAVFGTIAAPRIIDPLFHDFTPLADQELEREIVAVGENAGIDIQRVRVMDASRRTRRMNAYVTGIGATRQVVLYDNLVANAPREELLLVVAHEIGHQRARHVTRGLMATLPGIVLGVWALTVLAGWRARRDPTLDGPADPAGLPLLWLAVSVALFLSSPVSATISRRMEAEADWISLELTRDPDTFVAAERRLAETNLSWITPPEWIVRWFYSHPPVLNRIGMAEYWRAVHGDHAQSSPSAD
jgi:STE24 endopeptidase